MATAQALRKLNIERLKAEIAEAERAGDQAEKEEQEIYQLYQADERKRTEQSANRQSAREERMERLRQAFKQLPNNFTPSQFTSESFKGFNNAGFGQRPSSDSSRLYSKLLEMLGNLRGGGSPFDPVAEATAWREFEESAARRNLVTLSELPLPKSFLGMTNKDFKIMAIRWHPDKFLQKFGAKLHNDEAEDIQDAVVAVFQELNNAR